MANQTPAMPPYSDLLNPTLAALHRLGGSASVPELVDAVVTDIKPPREIVEQPHPGGTSWTELEYRLAWARTYLKKLGLIDNSVRGVWSLTPKGSEIKSVDPREAVRAVRATSSRTRQTRHALDALDEVEEPVEDATAPTREWRDTLLERLLAMPPDSFERLCMRLLREAGFIQVEVVGRSGDGGIDGYGVARLHGLLSFRVNFQCKRWRDNVGASVIRDFRGAMMGRAEKGLILTTGGFTRDARQEAIRDGATAIDLIDGELLAEKLKELSLGVRTRLEEVVEVDTDWFSSI
jgi:restriction system protein